MSKRHALKVNMLLQIMLCALMALAHGQNLPSFIRDRFTVPKLLCGRSCRFRFCIDRTSVLLIATGRVSGVHICRKFQEIDQILETGEALVSLESGEVPVSEWRPYGLSPPFSPDVFKTAKIPGGNHSGIVRTEGNTGNQASYLSDRCFILPIQRWELVRRFHGNRKRVVPVSAKDPEKDCIAFTPVLFDILFEVRWNSGDDLDLAIVEPGGTLLDFKNHTSLCGRHLGDAGVDHCEFNNNYIELVEYSADCELQKGNYTIRLNHASNCLMTDPPEATRYFVRVIVGGVERYKVSGSSNKDRGELIAEFNYTI